VSLPWLIQAFGLHPYERLRGLNHLDCFQVPCVYEFLTDCSPVLLINAPIGFTEWLGVPVRCGPHVAACGRFSAWVALWVPWCISVLAHGLYGGLMTDGVKKPAIVLMRVYLVAVVP
jgi:hypothetical protein